MGSAKYICFYRCGAPPKSFGAIQSLPAEIRRSFVQPCLFSLNLAQWYSQGSLCGRSNVNASSVSACSSYVPDMSQRKGWMGGLFSSTQNPLKLRFCGGIHNKVTQYTLERNFRWNFDGHITCVLKPRY